MSNFPTTARAARDATREAYVAQRAEFLDATRERLFKEHTKDSAIRETLAQGCRSLPKSKGEAVQYLAAEYWNATDAHRSYEMLKAAARAEEDIEEGITGSKKSAEAVLAKVAEFTSNVEMALGNADRLIELGASLRSASEKAGLWDSVEYVATRESEPMAPVEALRAVVAETTDEMLATYNHRALSRSTSVVSNLCDDIKAEATASWLKDAKRILDRYDYVAKRNA